MASITDLVAALRRRDGVAAVVVLGRDGLLIDGQADELAADDLAAHVPSIVSAADELGAASRGGGLTTALLEFNGTLAIVSVLSTDALLLVLTNPGSHIGPLLFELRKHREQIASLV
ncbi:MAG TPA: roadblock/LC7 domain-containing protein [Gemmatimonadales bacterium]|nr:roadblock/LC7 domain-containing protein [Gemmatimonadales bacterium]